MKRKKDDFVCYSSTILSSSFVSFRNLICMVCVSMCTYCIVLVLSFLRQCFVFPSVSTILSFHQFLMVKFIRRFTTSIRHCRFLFFCFFLRSFAVWTATKWNWILRTKNWIELACFRHHASFVSIVTMHL